MIWGLVILFLIAAGALAVVGFALVWVGVQRPTRITEGAALARGLPLDPAEIGVSHEEVVVKLGDGKRAPVWVMPGEREGGPDIFILHGWGDSRHGGLQWAKIVLPLAGRVMVWDQRGHGVSEHRVCEWGVGESADAMTIIEAVRGEGAKESAGPLVLMGLSMGASVALKVAGMREEVAAVVLDSPYRTAGEVVTQTLRVNQMPAWPLVRGVFAVMGWVRPGLSEIENVEAAAGVGVPMVIMHGRADRITPPVCAEAIARAAADASVVWFDECDHLAAACAETERYREAVGVFLEKVAG